MIRCMDRWSLAAIGVASSILLLFGSKHTRARGVMQLSLIGALYMR
jgi:hypothetical protein